MASRLKKPSLSLVGLSTLLFNRASHRLLVLWVSGLMLAACGFEPIYRADNLSAGVLSSLEVPDSRLGRQLERSLQSRLRLLPDAPWAASLKIYETLENRQLDSQGVAQGSRLTHRLELALRARADGQTRLVDFSETQFLSRSDSGGDEVAKVRALRALAVQGLSQKLATFLESLASEPTR